MPLYSRWQSKPWPGTPIDWGHPLAQGLAGAWVLNEGAGPTTNLVSGQSFPLYTGATWVPSPHGSAIKNTSTSDPAINSILLDAPVAAPFSVTVAFQYKVSDAMVIAWATTAGPDQYIGLWCSFTGTNDINVYCSGALTPVIWTDTTNFVADKWLIATVVFDSTSNLSIPCTLYVNGITYSTQISDGTNPINPPVKLTAGGLGAGGGHTLERPISAIFFHGSALSPDLARAMTLNPWQLFAPQSAHRLIRSGAASFTLSAATGVFTETGNAANLIYPRRMPAATGTFTETGNDASLFLTRTLAVTFPFATTAQSFTSSAGSVNSVLSYDAAVGNPAGALKTVTSGSGRSDNNSWTRTLTYEAMGLASGSTVRGITGGSLDSRCTAFASGTGCTSGAATLVDGATTVTLSAQRAFSATDGAYVNTTGTNLTGLSKASNNSVTLTIPNHLGTTSGGSGKGVTLYQDNLNFTIAYSPAFVANNYSLTAATGTFTVTGNAANLLLGRKVIAAVGTFTETGIAANLLHGFKVIAATGTFTETGVAAILIHNYPLIAARGTFTETGVAAALKASRKLTASVGTFTETGVAAGLLHGFKVIASAGSFVETGRAANLLHGFRVIASVGAFTETGIAANLKATRILVASTGTFVETGLAAGLFKGRTLIASVGAFTETGIAAGLRATRILVAAKGTFTETGNAAGLAHGFKVIASVGTFTETGIAANLLASHRLTAAVGSFIETGVAAVLFRGRTVIAAAGAFTETGRAANLLFGHRLTAAVGSFAESGVAANLIRGRAVIAAKGTFTETGVAANLLVGHRLIASAGSFTETGIAAVLTKAAARTLMAATGTFVETGIAANLKASRKLTAATGTFTEIGIAAGLFKGRTLVASAGTFTETGIAANLRTTRVVLASAGAFAETGRAANLLASRRLVAAVGTFTETGVAARLLHGFRLIAAPGSFAESGFAAILLRTRALVADLGQFVEVGNPATLTYTAISSAVQPFREALTAKLYASASLTALVGDRIYYGVLPQKLDLGRDGDAITYFVVSHPMGRQLTGPDGTATARVQISAWSHRGKSANRISEAVRNLLDGPPGVWGNGTVKIMSCIKVGETTLPEEPRAGSDQWTYQVASDYSIQHRISIPA